MEHRDLAQFAMYRSPTSYIELKKAVKDFAAGRNAFRAARPSQRPQDPVRVLNRKDAVRSDNLEHKVDALTNQLAELSLMIAKKSAGASQADRSNNMNCSFCKEPGHSASRFRVNLHRDTRCSKCGKIGHAIETCWAKEGRYGTPQIALAPRSGDQTGSKQVTFIAESTDGGLVAAAKRNAEGEAIPKQRKIRDEVTIPKLLNPSRTVPPGLPMAPGRTLFEAPIARKPKRKKMKTRKAALQEHVGKYNVVSELARAPSGLTFGQLVLGDAESARREINGLLARKARRRPGFAGPVELQPRRLRITTVRVYGTEAHAMLDSGAVPNIMSPKLVQKLSLTPKATKKHITVANGKDEPCMGILEQVPVSFGNLVSKMDFLVVNGAPYDVIIGLPALEEIQACIDLGRQHVQVTVNNRKTRLGLEMDNGPREDESSTDSEDFTSDSPAGPAESSDDETEYVFAVRDKEPFETDSEFPPENDDEGDLEREKWDLLNTKLCQIEKDRADKVTASIRDAAIAAWYLDDLLPADVPVTHSFELEDKRPISLKARWLPPIYNDAVRKELGKMEKAGIIKPSASAWSFPVVIVRKKDGKPRFCVDYRLLNRNMKPDKWPLPKIEEIFDDLEGGKVFSTLDLFSGYWQVRMAEECKEKTTFVCRYGTFKFEVMPFGLMNAPSTFQRMMDYVFRDLPFVRVYLDDVVVFSYSMSAHVEHLLQVFQVIAKSGLKLKIEKCAFAQSQTKPLGHVVGNEGIAVDQEKISAIVNTPEPRTVTEMRSFLGLSGYYRRFILRFAEVFAVLHATTSAKAKFSFTKEMRSAFEVLKQKLTTPPLLSLPDFDVPFVVETDASSVAVGAVLAQKKKDGKIHPVQYASRTMKKTERNYSACEREAFTVIFALMKFRVYLLSTQRFLLITDHQSLQYAFKKKDMHGRLACWMDFLAEYDFEVKYRAGVKNGAADFLSRLRAVLPSDEDGEKGEDLVCSILVSISEHKKGLEPHLRDTYRLLEMQEMVEQESGKRSSIKQNAKRFMTWSGRLFRRTKKGLRLVPGMGKRVEILR